MSEVGLCQWFSWPIRTRYLRVKARMLTTKPLTWRAYLFFNYNKLLLVICESSHIETDTLRKASYIDVPFSLLLQCFIVQTNMNENVCRALEGDQIWRMLSFRSLIRTKQYKYASFIFSSNVDCAINYVLHKHYLDR